MYLRSRVVCLFVFRIHLGTIGLNVEKLVSLDVNVLFESAVICQKEESKKQVESCADVDCLRFQRTI